MSIRSNAASVVFENVSKVYGGAGSDSVRAIDNVSLRVDPGELVTLLGPSGCGKTTTLRLIAGLERATEGRILIGDHDVTGLPATDRDVSMVFAEGRWTALSADRLICVLFWRCRAVLTVPPRPGC